MMSLVCNTTFFNSLESISLGGGASFVGIVACMINELVMLAVGSLEMTRAAKKEREEIASYEEYNIRSRK
jgi:hypothetical protein